MPRFDQEFRHWVGRLVHDTRTDIVLRLVRRKRVDQCKRHTKLETRVCKASSLELARKLVLSAQLRPSFGLDGVQRPTKVLVSNIYVRCTGRWGGRGARACSLHHGHRVIKAVAFTPRDARSEGVQAIAPTEKSMRSLFRRSLTSTGCRYIVFEVKENRVRVW